MRYEVINSELLSRHSEILWLYYSIRYEVKIETPSCYAILSHNFDILSHNSDMLRHNVEIRPYVRTALPF